MPQIFSVVSNLIRVFGEKWEALIPIDKHFFISITTNNTNIKYMYTKHSNYVFHCCLRTHLSPLFSDDECSMDLLRVWRALSFFWILSDDGSWRETGLFLFQNWCHLNEQTHTMDLYPPALGTIPFGYWVSRVLSPSSKARDGFGLYT